MAKIHGKNSEFTLATVDLTTFLSDISFPRTADMAETSAMGQDSKTYVKGLEDATISLSGQWDGTASTGPDDTLNTAYFGEAAVAWEYRPEGTGVGFVQYSGNAFVTSYQPSSSVADAVLFTADLQITGDVTRTVQT